MYRNSETKPRDEDTQFDFELRRFLAARNGGGDGKVTQEAVDDLLVLFITEARQWQHQSISSTSAPSSDTRREGWKPPDRDGRKAEARTSSSIESKKVCYLCKKECRWKKDCQKLKDWMAKKQETPECFETIGEGY